jgi:hypothetical protein
VQLKAQYMQDINAISYAWSPAAAIRLKELFFLKYEQHPSPVVVDVTAHFKNEWCNARLGNWSSGHAINCVINTNGLEATNRVIKDELTYRQLMPVMDFLQSSLVWLHEQSEKRSDEVNGLLNANKVTFATEHSFTTNNWTETNSWRLDESRQIRFLPEQNVYVAVAPMLERVLT